MPLRRGNFSGRFTFVRHAFSRADNGSVRWYNVDLPDAIAYREQFIAPTERERNIAKSMFDYSWLGEILHYLKGMFALSDERVVH
jgi:hypothetical protein